jgi:hypothetical protein
MQEKYGLRLPRRVVTLDYGDDVGDLFVRFRHVGHADGEPTGDGRVIVYYDERRINLFFRAKKWRGGPKIMEPESVTICSGLNWIGFRIIQYLT